MEVSKKNYFVFAYFIGIIPSEFRVLIKVNSHEFLNFKCGY